MRERPFALDDLDDRILAQAEIAADQPIAKPIGMHAEHLLDLLVRRTLAHLAPKFDTLALAAARPDLTRSLISSRSNSARPAMMVRISLPLAVLRSKLRPA